MVDQSCLQYFDREDIYLHSIYLTSFQGDESHSSPGIYGAAQSRGTYFVPMTEPDYIMPKQDNKPKSATDIELKSVPQTSQNVSAQFFGQQLSNQIGSGKTETDNDDDEDQINTSIDYISLTKVPENILKPTDSCFVRVSYQLITRFKAIDKTSDKVQFIFDTLKSPLCYLLDNMLISCQVSENTDPFY